VADETARYADALFTECAEDLPTLGIDPWSSGSPSGGQGFLEDSARFHIAHLLTRLSRASSQSLGGSANSDRATNGIELVDNQEKY
jgi:hypothetical protein